MFERVCVWQKQLLQRIRIGKLYPETLKLVYFAHTDANQTNTHTRAQAHTVYKCKYRFVFSVIVYVLYRLDALGVDIAGSMCM